jgi:histidinol-phosphate aminotransferase
MNLESLIRPNVRVMKPYSSARDEFQGDARVMLDANENSLGSAGPAEFNRYPDPQQRALKQALGPLKGVAPDQVFLSNGSDEVIDLLVRLVARPGQDSILSTPPTFGMYEVAAALNDVTLERVPLDADFQLSQEAIAQILALASQAKIVFLCSPNNPTGNLLRTADIEQILRGFPGLVVVDEAYADFADQPSWLTRLAEFENLVVLQTFSKAWGLAGIRLGMAFGSPELVAYLNRIKMPYNVSENTQRLALAALADTARFEAMRQQLLQSRATLQAELAALPIVDHIFPSDANFLLTRFVPEVGAVYQHLLNQGIVVRRPTQAACAGTLRLTVGTAAENDALITALREFV